MMVSVEVEGGQEEISTEISNEMLLRILGDG
jgi:hypothetical protein